MIITRLTADRYRNLRQVTIEPAPGLNILCGDNAQGKTNLIEAIWLFTGARSFRAGSESGLVMFGETQARIEAAYHAGGRDQTAAITWGSQGGAQKEILRNGITLSGVSELAGGFPCVVFSPSHLSLIKDGPEVRRRFLDTLLGQVSPGMIPLFLEYRRTIAQRCALLRDIPRQAQLLEMLPVYDEMAARQGGRIARARAELVRRLSVAASEYYREIARDAERMEVRLRTNLPAYEDRDRQARQTGWLHLIEAARAEDIAKGMTTVGPHRDDLEIFLDGRSIRLFGSQGQQRSALLALKLAECTVLGDALSEEPVILLDDVLSELDPARQGFILSHLGGRQVFITCCDPAMLQKAAPDGKVFVVSKGDVVVRK